MISWNVCTAMMKADVNNKHVPFKKTRMMIEGESNLVPVMPLLALRFISDLAEKEIISTTIQHVKGLTG